MRIPVAMVEVNGLQAPSFSDGHLNMLNTTSETSGEAYERAVKEAAAEAGSESPAEIELRGSLAALLKSRLPLHRPCDSRDIILQVSGSLPRVDGQIDRR